jgi:hypothetical protein
MLYTPDGQVIPPSHFGPILKEIELSVRETEIIKDVTVWHVHHHFEPTLVCKTCAQNGMPPESFKMQFSVLPTGQVVISCGCSRFVGYAPMPAIRPLETVVVSLVPGQKKSRPISTKEAHLAQAWKAIQRTHNWATGLMCNDCFANQTETGEGSDCSVHGATTDDVVTFNCACTIREWQGVNK